jgi:nucleotidyltransferase/DNA polymerase involved in DNA repair
MWVPELPFQLACGRDGGLRDRPLAFLNPESPRSPILWFVNRLGRAEGLAPGLPLDQALRTAPGLRVLEPSPQVWWEAQGSLGDFLQHWTPQGQLMRMGEALVELQGTQRIYGPLADTAQRMRRGLAEQHGWATHGGLSLSATAAQLAAHVEHQLELVMDGAEAAFLGPHLLRRLPDLAPRIQERFHRLGLRSFGDLQPVPLPVLAELTNPKLAPDLRARVRGEDRPRLPLLTERPGHARHGWRLQLPRLPEEVALAARCLDWLWSDPRHPRRLVLRWWDVDGEIHTWRAANEDLTAPPLALARRLQQAFLAGATRRLLVREVELRLAWGLGRERGLFQDPLHARLDRLEPVLARLRRRFPDQAILPGWVGRAPPPGTRNQASPFIRWQVK